MAVLFPGLVPDEVTTLLSCYVNLFKRLRLGGKKEKDKEKKKFMLEHTSLFFIGFCNNLFSVFFVFRNAVVYGSSTKPCLTQYLIPGISAT